MSRFVIILAGVVAVLIVLPVIVLLLLSSPVQMTAASQPPMIGIATPIGLHIDSPHGLRRLEASIEQNGQRFSTYQMTTPATRLFFRKNQPARDVTLEVGKTKAPQLKDGKARVIIEAQANDFRANTATLAWDVEVNTQPPFVSADGFQHYITQGGSEMVVFNVSGAWDEAGVRVGQYKFRSFAMPGQPTATGVKAQRLCVFAYPIDVPDGTEPIVYARNSAGNEARAHFWNRIKNKSYRHRDLNLSLIHI